MNCDVFITNVPVCPLLEEGMGKLQLLRDSRGGTQAHPMADPGRGTRPTGGKAVRASTGPCRRGHGGPARTHTWAQAEALRGQWSSKYRQGRLCGEGAAGGGGVPGTSMPAVHRVGRDPGQLMAYLPGAGGRGQGIRNRVLIVATAFGGRREQSKPEAVWTEEVMTSDPRN